MQFGWCAYNVICIPLNIHPKAKDEPKRGKRCKPKICCGFHLRKVVMYFSLHGIFSAIQNVRLYQCVYTSVCVYIHQYVCVYTSVCVCTCLSLSTCVCVCVCVCCVFDVSDTGVMLCEGCDRNDGLQCRS